jgi:hypothetical protein
MHTHRLGLALVALSACSFGFDSPSQIKDLRVLAIQVEPPELTPANALGGLTVKALVVNTEALGSISWSLAMCLTAPKTGTGLGRCPEGSTVLTSANTSLDEVALRGPLPPAVLGILQSHQALAPQLQLELTVGDAPLYAEKSVAVTPMLTQAPNSNPVLSGLTFDGEPWLAGAPLGVKVGQCASDKKETVTNADRSKSTFCTHDLVPSVDESQQQLYEARSTTTGEVTTQQERLRLAWFADQGVLHRATTQQAGATGNPTASSDLSNVWREAEGLSGLVHFWVVVRDGRGGESWEVRSLLLE